MKKLKFPMFIKLCNTSKTSKELLFISTSPTTSITQSYNNLTKARTKIWWDKRLVANANQAQGNLGECHQLFNPPEN